MPNSSPNPQLLIFQTICEAVYRAILAAVARISSRTFSIHRYLEYGTTIARCLLRLASVRLTLEKAPGRITPREFARLAQAARFINILFASPIDFSPWISPSPDELAPTPSQPTESPRASIESRPRHSASHSSRDLSPQFRTPSWEIPLMPGMPLSATGSPRPSLRIPKPEFPQSQIPNSDSDSDIPHSAFRTPQSFPCRVLTAPGAALASLCHAVALMKVCLGFELPDPNSPEPPPLADDSPFHSVSMSSIPPMSSIASIPSVSSSPPYALHALSPPPP